MKKIKMTVRTIFVAVLAMLLMLGTATPTIARDVEMNHFNPVQEFIFEEGNIPFAPPGVYPVAQETIDISMFNYDIIYVAAPLLDPFADSHGLYFMPDGVAPALDCLCEINDIRIDEIDSKYISIEPMTPLTPLTINYRGNGHTGGNVPTSHTVQVGQTATLRQRGNMVRAGYIFLGWRDSRGQLFQPGHSWTVTIGGTMTFDAMWSNTVTIRYRSSGHDIGGLVPASQTVRTPGSIHLRPQGTFGTLVRAGHSFMGWRHLDSGRLFQANEYVTWSNVTAGTMYLDADWVRNRATIEYTGNGNTSGTAPASHTVWPGETATLAQQGTLQRVGYRFGGWTVDGSAVWPAGFSWTPVINSPDVQFRFHAVWVRN